MVSFLHHQRKPAKEAQVLSCQKHEQELHKGEQIRNMTRLHD